MLHICSMITKNISISFFTRILLGLAVLGFNACQEKAATGPTASDSPPLPVKEVILEGLAHPWSMSFINEDEAFISEKDGDLLRVDLVEGTTHRIGGFPEDLMASLLIEVADYPPRTYPTSLDGRTLKGNGGILDVLLHPDFAMNAQVFISYVSQIDKTFALKVISAKVVNDSLEDIKTLLNPGPYVPGLWHFGGGLCLQDNYLFITAGERLFFEDLKTGLPIAQDVTDARGAIYRLHLDGSIPTDNPDFGSTGIPGIYAFGIRAAQGITTRPGTKDIWFSEHGTNQGDELNLLRAGANYGWPNVTSGTWRSPGYVPDSLPQPQYVNPQHYWLQTVAPTGLTFYTGPDFPSWQGNLIVPGLSRGSLWRMVLDNNTVVSAEELFLDDHVRSRKVAQSPEGKLYLLTDEDNGKLIRIINKNRAEG